MLLRELKFAVRSLRKTPGFTIVASLTIALGIGASTALFSVANAVLLRPLPYKDPSRLVTVWGDLTARNLKDFPFAPGDLPDLREQGTLFEGFAGLQTGRGFLPTASGDPEQIRTGFATTNLFSLLGVSMAAGRDFEDADGTPPPAPPGAPGPPGAGGAAPGPAVAAAPPGPPPPPPPPQIAIVSHGFWLRHFGGDPSAIGSVIDFGLGGGHARIVGVLPAEFEMLFAPRLNIETTPDIWIAQRINFDTASRINVSQRVIGRLKPTVTLARAQGQADAISADLNRRFPIKKTAGFHIRLEPMHEDLVADVKPAILTLLGAVTFVLLIACANVANLLLVRASTRERELAIRAALGSSQSRIVRQLLLESLVLAGIGALLGLLLAQMGIRLLTLLKPDNLPRLDAIAIDPVVLGFAAAATVTSAVVFGLVPAIRASRPDVMDVLRQSGAQGLRAGRTLRGVVVMAEVALSFVLLVGAGLMVRSFAELQRANPGYRTDGLLTFNLQVQGPRFQKPEARSAFTNLVRDRLAALPGVQSVSAALPLPLDGGLFNARWGTMDAAADPSKFQQADVHQVLLGYFDTMDSHIVQGRAFAEPDNAPGQHLVIIDSILARKAFPKQSPIGQHLLLRVTTTDPETFEVIGVAQHERPVSLAVDGREAAYLPDGFFGFGTGLRWVVRSNTDPSVLGATIRAEVAKVERTAVITQLQPMSVFVDKAMAPTRFALALIGVFAVIAVVLAAVGLYGVLSTAVRQRTAEIGVRMAFGASAVTILGMLIRQGLRLSALGVAAGLVAAFSLTGLMRTMLVGVKPTDPATFVAITLLFLGVATIASLVPAMRAARLDPTKALREE